MLTNAAFLDQNPFSVTRSFRNHSNMLICCSRNISYINVERICTVKDLLSHYIWIYCHFWSIERILAE